MSGTIALLYERLVGRPSSFPMRIGLSNAVRALIGYVWLDDQIRSAAHTLESASQAADPRLFRDRYTVSGWQQKAVNGVHPRRPRIAL